MKRMNHTEYPKSLRTKSWSHVKWIQTDAYEAATVHPEGENAGYYMDEFHYATMELKRRLQGAGA